jgi:hypothetical protein
MPRDAQGGYNLPFGTLAKAGETILVSQHNPAMTDIAQALAGSLAKDGRTVMTGPLKMGGNPVTGAGPGLEFDHLVTRGQVLDLIAGGDGGGGGTGTGGDASLADFHSSGDTHDMQAVWRAYRLGHRRIRAAMGTGLGARLGAAHAGKFIATGLPFTGLKPGGDPSDPTDYNTSRGNLCLPMDGLPGAGEPMHGLEIYGDGMGRTVWKQVDNFAFNVNVQSANVANNIKGVRFHDFTIEGLGDPVATQTGHIYAISGATGMTWERVEFRDFNADAVCFWPSPNPDEETHNVAPVFRNCVFDGGNSANRNCISIEDGVNGIVEGCTFRNACTDSDAVSVAAIDWEPRDKTFYRVSGWRVDKCDFYDINRGALAFYLNGPDYYTIPPRGFTVTSCNFYRCKRLWDFSGSFTDQFPGALSRHGIDISGCTATDCGDVRFLGMWGVRVHDNDFLRCDIVKFGDAIAKGNRGVEVYNNTFTRSKQNIVVLHDDDTIGCAFRDNRLYDCGLQFATDQPGYVLIARRGSVGTRFSGNRIENPNGRLKAGFILTDSATYGASAEKDNNFAIGTAYTLADTFNPPATNAGNRLLYTFPSSAGFGNGVAQYFDIPFTGATPDKAYSVTHNQLEFSPGGEPLTRWTASCCRQLGVVRVVVTNSGAGVTTPAGETMTIREAA